MTRVEEKFAEAFGIPPISDVVDSTENVPVAAEQQAEAKPERTAEQDFEFVRGTLYNLIKNGAEAFEQLSEIARVEEKISAYGTMNEMLSNLSDISMKLMEIHERKNKLTGGSNKQDNQPSNVTNNIVYAGSLSDLDKLLDKGDVIDV